MQGYLKATFCLLLALGVLKISLPVAYSQEEAMPPAVLINEISGRIAAIDLENSTIVIQELKDKENEIYQDITVAVDEVTAIEKDFLPVTLTELAIGDEAVVKYTINEEERNIAAQIKIKVEGEQAVGSESQEDTENQDYIE